MIARLVDILTGTPSKITASALTESRDDPPSRLACTGLAATLLSTWALGFVTHAIPCPSKHAHTSAWEHAAYSPSVSLEDQRPFSSTTFNHSVLMASLETTDSPQVKFILSWLQATAARDIDGFAKQLHKDFRYAMFPQSIGRPGESNKEEWLRDFGGFIGLWAEDSKVSHMGCYLGIFSSVKPLPQITFHSIVETPGTVVVHVRI